MSDPLLPSGIHIGSGRDEEDNPVVVVNLKGETPLGLVDGAIVLPPSGMRLLAALVSLLGEGPATRSFTALLLRQADLTEGQGLHVVGGRG